MERRYDVFISSTREDLEVERRTIADELLRRRYMPIGMEQFGAATEQAWTVIQHFIDECDYCIVVIAGKYGSVRENGVSYTESEYNYAVKKEIPVLAFVHSDLSKLPIERVESNSTQKEALAAFVAKIQQERVWDTWSTPDDLARKVSVALDNLTRTAPAIGWIRGNAVRPELAASMDALVEPCLRLGIARVSRSGISGPEMRARLGEAKTVKIMATSGIRLVETYQGELVEALVKGCSMQILVAKPDTAFLSDVEEYESVHEKRPSISAEIEILQQRLREALAEASRRSSEPGKVAIGFYTTHLRSTIVLCDDAWGWLTVMLSPLRATQSMSLEMITTSGRPLIQSCVEHFDRAWTIIEQRGDATMIRRP